MSAARDRSNASTARVGPLPTRSQTTFGGGPSAADSLWKSAAFDTTASPRAAANAHTARSSAAASPASSTCSEQVLVEQQAHAAGLGIWLAA